MIAIDLGSNSLRMIQMDCEKRRFIQEYDKIVKTAELLHSEGIIAEASIQRILDGFDEASSLFDFKQEKCVAELTLLAVERRLESLGFRGSFVLIDIGGASTEVIFKKGNLSESKSFPIGIVTMASKYPSRSQMDTNLMEELSDIKAYVAEYHAREGKPDFFVATAGTPTTIAAFKQGMTYDTYDAARINGSTLNYFDCTHTLDELLGLSVEERTRYVGVGREELIIAGVMIYATLFRLFDYENSVIIDDGLREGLAISVCEQG
jgi:exopolyphosphatase / guanosine-5'-triphosphate,3'-diphosphate pyrophosphatase